MAHMVPHVEIEANGNAALGGCCSRFSDEAVVVYKDDRLELREYNVSCCSGGDEKRRRYQEPTMNELDHRFRDAYGVNFRDVSEAVDIDLTEGITFLQFKAIRNQALHDKIVRHYGVALKEAVEALRIDIDPVKGLSVREVQRIENWAREHSKKQAEEHDIASPVFSLEALHKKTVEAAAKELGIETDPEHEFSSQEIWDIENWIKRNGRHQATEYDAPMSPMPSLEEMPPQNAIGSADHSPHGAEASHQSGLPATESQKLRLAGLVQRAVMLVVNGLTPRQLQAMRERREAESQRTMEVMRDRRGAESPKAMEERQSVEERKSTGAKKELGNQIEVDV